MRFPPLVALSAFAAFATGYAISRAWSSANSSGINEIKTAIHNAKTVARAVTAESNTERLIALCEKPGSLSRDREIFETLQRMDGADFLRAVADFPALVARFDKLPYDLKNDLTSAAIERWLEVDPSGAKQWLTTAQKLSKALPGKDDGQLDTQLLLAIIPHLVRNDPDWCMARIEDMQGRSKTDAIFLAISETAKTDPVKARQMREGLKGENEIDNGVQGVIAGLAESDPQAAMALAAGLSKPNEKRLACNAVIFAAGPRGAAVQRELLSQVDDPQLRPLLIYYTTHAIAEQSTSDPVAFFEEQLALQDEAARPNLLRLGAIRTLFDTYPDRTMEFIGRLEGKARDAGIESMLMVGSERNAFATVEWLRTLPVETLPVGAWNWDRTLTKLADRAPADFQQWVDSLPSGQLQDASRVLLATRQAGRGNID